MSKQLSGSKPTQFPQPQTSFPNEQTFQHQQQPREVGTPAQEVQRVVNDVKDQLGQLPMEMIKDVLGIHRDPKSPEEVAKVRRFHQTWQQLDVDQQAVAKQRLHAEAERKRIIQEKIELKKEQEIKTVQQKQFTIPQGKVSGQAALDKMQKDRKGMGGASG